MHLTLYSDRPDPLRAFAPLPVVPRLSVATDVCPRCKRAVTSHSFLCDGVKIASYHCAEHGDVIPMRSEVVNDDGA